MNIQSYYHFNSPKVTTTAQTDNITLPTNETTDLSKESKITRQGTYFTYNTYLKNGMIAKIEPTGTVKSMEL